MRSNWQAAATIIGGALVLAPRQVTASDALWIQPSSQWYGIDGTWSSFSFAVGSPLQTVDLTVSTALSETWVVSTGGCSPNPLCTAARGGVFNVSRSSSWKSLGSWQLGLPDLALGGNGDYGLESIAWTNTLTSSTTSIQGALLSAINDTDYFQGFLGVGANTVKLGANETDSVISQLAQDYGTIPSHSYGYTAGAYYAGSNGTVGSLVLGGYDSLRFVSHTTNFTLDPNTRIPSVLVRGVTAQVPSLDDAPTTWNSTTQTLIGQGDTIAAIIDTSTPYLWMPNSTCDRFAAAFNLTWSDDYGVYLFADNDAYTRFKNDDSLSITFTLSSFDNSDDFSGPLNTPGMINITFSPAAFAQTLRYPFKNLIEYGSPAVPYFPLKRHNTTGGKQYVLGRAFMQGAYIKTLYDTDVFSLHEALFPDNAATNFSIHNMERPSNSAYLPYSGSYHKNSLTTGQIVGIVIGAFGTGIAIGLCAWVCCKRRRTKQPEADPNKEDSESIEDELPRSPVRRMFSMIIGRRRSRRPAANEVHGDSAQPAEVAADASHELYELPVPVEPVELDSTNYVGDDAVDVGMQGMSSYEIAKRNMERQLHGPAPAYSPPSTAYEKNGQDISPVPHYRPSDHPSPTSSPTSTPSYGTNTNSLPDFLPSPVTPFPGEGTRHFDFASPLTILPPLPSPLSPRHPGTVSDPSSGTYTIPSPNSPNSLNSPNSPSSPDFIPSPQHTFEPSSVSRSSSSNVSPTSPTGPGFPAPAYQRTPIDPSRVVCLGPLPENVQLQLPQSPPRSVPRLITPDGQIIIPTPGDSGMTHSPSGMAHSPSARDRLGSVDSLGSNFTVEEETRFRDEVARHQSVRRGEDDGEGSAQPRSPNSMERIDAASELVHVPQIADKRYSWEEDRAT